MKKKLLILLCIFSLTIVGCKKQKNNIVENLSTKINNLDSYNIKGNLEIVNGEDMYLYDVEVSYQKNDNFKVYLKNTNNNHIQILLKNEDGVYVQAHKSLNTSFFIPFIIENTSII